MVLFLAGMFIGSVVGIFTLLLVMGADERRKK